MHNWKI